jgi:DnaJ domain/PASTA domain
MRQRAAGRMLAPVADSITWYDILGVSAGASSDTLHYAYSERVQQLAPELVSGAAAPVVSAAGRAREAVEAAWLVLGDPDRRQWYDKEIGLHRGRGLRGSSGFGEGSAQYGQDPYDLMRAAGGLADRNSLDAFTALLSWMGPAPAQRRRRRVVPDLRGLFYRPCQAVVTMAGLRLAVVRLTPDPMPVEGLVVGQSPAAGAAVRGLSTLTVQLWHPPRDQALPGPKHK